MQKGEVTQIERAWDISLLSVRSETSATSKPFIPSLFPRQGYSLTTSATQNGELFLFGGVVDGVKRNDLYSISTRLHTANLIRASGEPPSPRAGHKIVLVDNLLVVLGGDTRIDDSPFPCVDNALYIFNLVTATWTRLENSGPAPSGRYDHTMTLDGTTIYVYGGRSIESLSDDGTVHGKEIMLGDLWALDIHSLRSTPSWEHIEVFKEPRRAGHVCVPKNGKLYIFGGSYAYATIYESDIRKWSRLTLDNSPVSQSQIEHGVSLFGDIACVLNRKRAEDDYFDDRLQLLNVSDGTWLTLPIGGRMHSNFSMAFIGSKVVLLGWEETSIIQTLAIEHIMDFISLKQTKLPEITSKGPESGTAEAFQTSQTNSPDFMRELPYNPVPPDPSPSDVHIITFYSTQEDPVGLEPQSETKSEPGSRSESEYESDWTSDFRTKLKISQTEKLRELETQAEIDYRRQKADLEEALYMHIITHIEARDGIAQLYEALEDQRRLIRQDLRKERDKEVERRRNTYKFFLGDTQDTTEVMKMFSSGQETFSTFQPPEENPWTQSHETPVLSPSCTPTDSGETDAIRTSDENSLSDVDIGFAPTDGRETDSIYASDWLSLLGESIEFATADSGEKDARYTSAEVLLPHKSIESASDKTFDNSPLSSPVHTPKDTLEWLLLQFADLDLTEKLNEGEHMKASGGYADVYFGKLLDGTLVAIKRVRMHLQGDDLTTAKRIARELRVWLRLRHENILPLKGFIRKDADPFPSLVTEWMENGSLSQYLQKSPEVDNLDMIEGIASGLDYLHNEGVVHGDLKAANVVISPKGVPMLIDFGISHLSQATSSVDMPTNAKKGSFRWMSPELLTSQDEESEDIHTKESDVWAFGMTGLEVLTRTFPYAKLRNDAQVLRHISEGKTPEDPDDLQKWNDLDKSLLNFCKECWTKDRKDRPTIKRLVEKLEAIRIL